MTLAREQAILQASDERARYGGLAGIRGKDRPMDRRERSDMLEQLVVYRRTYHLRSDYDTKPLLSVRAAIARAERQLRAFRLAAARPA